MSVGSNEGITSFLFVLVVVLTTVSDLLNSLTSKYLVQYWFYDTQLKTALLHEINDNKQGLLITYCIYILKLHRLKLSRMLPKVDKRFRIENHYQSDFVRSNWSCQTVNKVCH